MISKVTVVACVFVVLASMSTAQRPLYNGYTGGWPWLTTGPQTNTPTTTPTSNNNNNGGLGDGKPFLMPVQSVRFRFYNNVPIEGPGMPCIGCVYKYTSNGFVMVRP
ncbi:uncharacterized protein LOC135947090 [Cloeon dipterum]|uniref:uncharacterized protein LOC135947090 n=1 Tax=Cloeon dipterum TaxID=197152 RepID=UPI0032208159